MKSGRTSGGAVGRALAKGTRGTQSAGARVRARERPVDSRGERSSLEHHTRQLGVALQHVPACACVFVCVCVRVGVRVRVRTW